MAKSIYDYQGNEIISIDAGIGINYDQNIKSVNHRGYSATAPENTLPAYRLSRQMGFTYVETDISFTSDGVPVCLHDSTIDRTSNGSGNINSLTYAQVRTYDFGSWKSPEYAGTKIPSFEEFITLCKDICLHPYIELKSAGAYTEAQIQQIVDMVDACGMKGKVTYISFSSTFLTYVKNYDANARLGFLATVTSANIATAQSLQTGSNEVFMDTNTNTSAGATLCRQAGLPMEIWTINSADTILSMDPYITGVTSDSLIAGKILYEANIED